jgi:hypothetical protein
VIGQVRGWEVVSAFIRGVVVMRDGVWCRVSELECRGMDGTGRSGQRKDPHIRQVSSSFDQRGEVRGRSPFSSGWLK